ncbi:MAG TPA: hypothetical protein VLE95_03340 [Chlamydiales bacterium]|nr:hypothetical protein [Chlamydiales bacterium]
MDQGFLGELFVNRRRFPDFGSVLKKFGRQEFLQLNDRKRSEEVNRTLYEWIKEEPDPCFLLPAVLEFIERIENEKILGHYTFTSFELWLNQSAHVSFEENSHIRGKIAGKWIPRSEYQKFFPVGMGKMYEGTHFVTAHKSPDLDTMVASFWGWLDAFAARVGDGLHIWNLPGGSPSSVVEIDLIFKDIFGSAVLTHLMKTRSALNLTGNDLMTQSGMKRVSLDESIVSMDHGREHKSFVIVDSAGAYLGDWRNIDVEGVHQIIILFHSCIFWFENCLHLQLISLFAKEDLQYEMASLHLKKTFALKIKDSEPASKFSSKQREDVQHFIVSVLGLQEGLDCTFERLSEHLASMGDVPFQGSAQMIQALKDLFEFNDESKSVFSQKKSDIFHFLESAIHTLHDAFLRMCARLEKMDIALKTKLNVFSHRPTFVTTRSDVDEIKNKMGSYHSLTVTYPEGERLWPVGTIYASDLRKSKLGTVSLRDFCNPDEMGIPSYIEVISVIDHHKIQLNTFTPPLAVIADVQSCNTLVANLAFEVNDRYSLRGQTVQEIDEQLRGKGVSHTIMLKLLQRKLISPNTPYYVHPDREIVEYLHFLYAILNDTDLLSKVSAIDLECVASLLNRLKTLALKKETEIIDFTDLPRDSHFLKKAAQRILQNEDMYSLYRKIYHHRQQEEERNLALCVHGKPNPLFADTKEQNGCCRVGQTKLFAANFPFFQKHADAIRRAWLDAAMAVFEKKPEIMLHIHMISTIVSAEEVYSGASGSYKHQDELWIWIPEGEIPMEYLTKFLINFKDSPGLTDNPAMAEFLGSNGAELALIFKESFLRIEHTFSNRHLPLVVLRFRAGSLNSRKAMVSPFLPTSIS